MVLFGISTLVSPFSPSALATSCAVPKGDVSPRAIVEGRALGWDGQPIFETYDFAIAGSVTSVNTDEVPGSPTYGDTEVVFEVINAYRLESVDPLLVVWQSDPGWMMGFPFEVGRTYFVPLVHRGPGGEPNYSMLCDPISPMSVADAADLPQFASAELPVATPGVETTPTFDLLPTVEASVTPIVTTSGGEESASSGRGSGLLVVGAVGAVALAATGAVLVARRRR